MQLSLPILLYGSSFLLLVIIAIWLIIKRKNYITAIIIFAPCIAFPIIWVRRDCIIHSSSEACVWGQAFMPLYLGIALVTGSVIYFTWVLCLTLFLRMRKDK